MCRHEWVIETANGPTSLGECRLCHETKEFENSIAEDYGRQPGRKKKGDQSQDLELSKGNNLDTEDELSEMEMAS